MSLPNTHYGAKRIKEIMDGKCGSVFFAGAGGIMMSSLAIITKKAGYRVCGSDRARSALTDKLELLGIELHYTHAEDNIPSDCFALVYTVAISADNPEYLYAKSKGIPCISRADYLGYIMTGYKNRIGIAGMHGKSSVTSMCAQIFLDNAEMNTHDLPTVISGAEYAPMGGAYMVGGSNDLIFEACEYMDSFLDFNPTVAVLLNAEMEHVDYFKSIEQIQESFYKYACLVGDSGACVANADDQNIMKAISPLKCNVYTFGIENDAYAMAENIEVIGSRQEFDLYFGGIFAAHISMSTCGRHNVYNALAAALASHISGVDNEAIRQGLYNFCGAHRRMEYMGDISGASVYDDYGHHPTEVKATLSGADDMTSGRLICVFQPHTYSRTAALADDLSRAFDVCDKVILCDIYAAREQNTYNISSRDIADMIGDRAVYGGSIESCADLLLSELKSGDVAVVMGAGDIYKIYKLLGL